MPRVFVSYRREDSDVIAGRIRDWLARSFGDNSVFMDIDNIPVGVDFREHVKGVLLQNNILVAVIGPHWLGRSEGGRSRIHEETDPVRVEIEAALQRGTPVVPVLVHGASMPNPADLPAAMRSFAFHNAATVDSGRDFQHHMDRLIRSMNSLLKVGAASARRPWLWALAGALASAAVLLPAFWFYLRTMVPTMPAQSPAAIEAPAAVAAKAMLDRAVADLKADEAMALAKINKYEGDYYHDQYVFCFNIADGRYTAHPIKALIGTNVRTYKDSDGLPSGDMVFNAAKEGAVSTVAFRFHRPGGTIPVPMAAHVTKVGNQGCGVRFHR